MGLLAKVRRRLFGGNIGPVILMYHRVAELAVDPWGIAVTPTNFAEHMAYLRRRRTPLSVSEFLARRAKGTLPANAAAVTFDDGYVDNLTQAKPILEAENIPATFFVLTGAIEQPRPFWWDDLTQLVLCHRQAVDDVVEIGENPVRLRWPANGVAEEMPWLGWHPPRTPRQAAYVELWARLQLLTDAERDHHMTGLSARLGPIARDNHALPMNAAQLRRCCEGGLIELGGHTVSHSTLPALSPERRRAEIEGCLEHLTRLLGAPPAGFAYPYGDVNEAVRDDVARSGFAWACSTMDAPVRRASDLFALPRVNVYNWNKRQFARRLSPVPSLVSFS